MASFVIFWPRVTHKHMYRKNIYHPHLSVSLCLSVPHSVCMHMSPARHTQIRVPGERYLPPCNDRGRHRPHLTGQVNLCPGDIVSTPRWQGDHWSCKKRTGEQGGFRQVPSYLPPTLPWLLRAFIPLH